MARDDSLRILFLYSWPKVYIVKQILRALVKAPHPQLRIMLSLGRVDNIMLSK